MQNRFEKSARIFSRQHKQTTFSDAVFLGALRVNKHPMISVDGTIAKNYYDYTRETIQLIRYQGYTMETTKK